MATRRATFRMLACLWLFLLLVAGCSGSETSTSATSQEEEEAEATADPPNIVFVLADDLDYASAQEIPALGSLLVEDGASFEEAFASQSLCCPSRATILTGLYTHNHRVKGNLLKDGGGFEMFRALGHEKNTIAVHLQQEGGYRTAYFGKYLNGYAAGEPTYVPPGWDEWYGKLDQQKLYDYRINENGQVVYYGSEPENFFTDVLSGQVTDFVRRAAPDPEPFFMHVAPTAPHDSDANDTDANNAEDQETVTPAERHRDTFADKEAPRPSSFNEEDVSDKPSWIGKTDPLSDDEISLIDDRYRKRLESMLAVEEMVASLIEELEAAGELENTYIFFTSDNGWFQGEHRIHKGKDSPYEESARIPLFVRGPGVPAGSKVERFVLNTDFAPTFADLGGVEFPADGRSFMPLLRGEDPSSWRSAVLLEGFVGKRHRNYRAVRTETHKYVEYYRGEEELYDLRHDPYELESLHESVDASLVEDLKAKLDPLKNCSEEGCREAEDAP